MENNNHTYKEYKFFFKLDGEYSSNTTMATSNGHAANRFYAACNGDNVSEVSMILLG